MNTFPLATWGAPVIPVCIASHTGDSQISFAAVASIATKRQSPVPTYTLPFSDGNTAVGARRIRAIDGHVESHFGIELPKHLPRGRIDGINLRQRSADVDDSVDHNRFRHYANRAINIQEPSQTKLIDVLIGDLP